MRTRLRGCVAQYEKYDEPQTSAQEVGWMNKPLVAPNPRFVHGLKAGEATAKADDALEKASKALRTEMAAKGETAEK